LLGYDHLRGFAGNGILKLIGLTAYLSVSPKVSGARIWSGVINVGRA